MRHILVGLWKEARDQRTILLALLVVLPLLVLAVGWAFGDQIPRPTFAAYALFVVPIALALFLIAVASELFGGERRRGTLDFARRLPRGLVSAFAAKLAAYVAGSLLFAAWGWCVACVACMLFGPADAPGELLRITVDQPDFVVTACCLALVALGVWILLVSTWIPQGGAAVLGAGLLLGLLALPVVLALKESPWLVNQLKPRRLGELVVPLAVFAGLPLLVLALSFLRGNRFLSSAWSPAWRGLALLAVLASGGYAVGASALERALTIDPSDPGFRISNGCVGVGGRYAYVNVNRGFQPWHRGNEARNQIGTPNQPWIIDLQTGTHRRAGDYEEGWRAMIENRHALQPIVWRLGVTGEDVTWFDAATATARKVLPYAVRTPEILAWEREALARLSWSRDADGRALWFEGDALVREGDPVPQGMGHRSQNTGWVAPISGGWVRATWKSGRAHAERVTIEAATGKVRHWPYIEGITAGITLSPTHLLSRRMEPTLSGSMKRQPGPWRLLDLDSPRVDREIAVPAGVEGLWCVQQDGRVLLMTGTDPDPRRLCRWSPLTGDLTEVLDETGAPVVGHTFHGLAELPGDVRVLSVSRGGPPSAPPDRWILDGAAGRAQRIACRSWHFDPLAVVDAHTVIAVEHGSYIVRYGPEPGSRTQLFPRPR